MLPVSRNAKRSLLLADIDQVEMVSDCADRDILLILWTSILIDHRNGSRLSMGIQFPKMDGQQCCYHKSMGRQMAIFNI